MKSCIAAVFLLCMASVLCQVTFRTPKLGKPNFKFQGSGKGDIFKDYRVGFTAGIDTKVWEKKDKSLTLGATYGREFSRLGNTFQSKPFYGFGGTFTFGKK